MLQLVETGTKTGIRHAIHAYAKTNNIYIQHIYIYNIYIIYIIYIYIIYIQGNLDRIHII